MFFGAFRIFHNGPVGTLPNKNSQGRRELDPHPSPLQKLFLFSFSLSVHKIQKKSYTLHQYRYEFYAFVSDKR